MCDKKTSAVFWESAPYLCCGRTMLFLWWFVLPMARLMESSFVSRKNVISFKQMKSSVLFFSFQILKDSGLEKKHLVLVFIWNIYFLGISVVRDSFIVHHVLSSEEKTKEFLKYGCVLSKYDADSRSTVLSFIFRQYSFSSLHQFFWVEHTENSCWPAKLAVTVCDKCLETLL